MKQFLLRMLFILLVVIVSASFAHRSVSHNGEARYSIILKKITTVFHPKHLIGESFHH